MKKKNKFEMAKSSKVRQLHPLVIKVEPTEESTILPIKNVYILPEQKKTYSCEIYIIIVLVSFWLLS